jgi:hypothetical protein
MHCSARVIVPGLHLKNDRQAALRRGEARQPVVLALLQGGRVTADTPQRRQLPLKARRRRREVRPQARVRGALRRQPRQQVLPQQHLHSLAHRPGEFELHQILVCTV